MNQPIKVIAYEVEETGYWYVALAVGDKVVAQFAPADAMAFANAMESAMPVVADRLRNMASFAFNNNQAVREAALVQ